MKALVGKSMLMKNKIQRGTSFYTPFFHIYFFETQGNSKELKGTHLNSFEPIELKGTQRNSRELKGTQVNSSELKGTQGNSSELI